MRRRLLIINADQQSYQLETLRVETLPHDEREAYLTLHGEALCQYLLRRDPTSLIVARGPMAFLAGNKTTVGYISPLTDVPHYSFVGGRAAAQLFDLGLDAIVLLSGGQSDHYIVVSGRAPNLDVRFLDASDLPSGQRGAYYHLVATELDGTAESGSVFTLGNGAQHGYLTANVAVEGIYHAGRGGAGTVFARSARALVLRGIPQDRARFFAATGAEPVFARSPNRAMAQRLEQYTARLSGQTGGTVVKLYNTGGDPHVTKTLPSRNATQLGYELADLGGKRVLSATRDGHTGCHWCPVDCRHWHWVEADYAPGGRDRFLDDFEPTYALFSMLSLGSAKDTFQDRLALLREVDRRLMVPIEQMGCDVIDVGVGLAALFEGLEHGIVPRSDIPPGLREAGLSESTTTSQQRLETAVIAVDTLRQGLDDNLYPALRAVANGPQALAERYPAMQDILFTGGKKTLGNAGHSNALWTFLMPFSRFFSHYSGQIYKIDETLPPSPDDETLRRIFRRAVERMFAREYMSILCNALSCCAFTFVMFTQDGKGEQLDDGDLLVRTLAAYDIHTTRDDLMWFTQAFWAQSIDLKAQYGWRPPSATDLPQRIYEGLALVLAQPEKELVRWMDLLIDEWKTMARQVLEKFGYEITW
ncbi:MAG: aldehyde ferredoxin oxidoreductase N-terminal domain-containing protein [Chloroflexota bacterium]|nr:aldehyde ferredoxin oxidoreductase N-terminal domain-containing protein [Chloroflexota bacterium]